MRGRSAGLDDSCKRRNRRRSPAGDGLDQALADANESFGRTSSDIFASISTRGLGIFADDHRGATSRSLKYRFGDRLGDRHAGSQDMR
jgi:hypothetical protein